MRCFAILSTLLAAVTSVSAHGFALQVEAEGRTELTWNPWIDP
jgi:hypothetical protein